MTDQERYAILDRLDPRIGAWFTAWWGDRAVQAAALGHPWQTVPYGPLLSQSLNAIGRPYRYTMRRKIRRAVLK